jgi:predicted 2-oxoglutarate/Fe(II)-dependent dioxygenase YbiX|tara:strand:+ start:160 stop:768 length:609 start_codon:yes stop_codon:yes gene_type:complete
MLGATSQLQDFIVTKDDVFSSKICDELINEYENEIWENSITIGDRTTDYRVCKQITISSRQIIKDSEHRKQLDQTVFETITPLLKEYAEKFDGFFNYESDTGYNILKYEPGDFYKEHTDQIEKNWFNEQGQISKDCLVKRKVTLIVQLNEEFEGGGLSFFGNTFKTKIKKGSVILFPANLLFPHQALPVTKGTRYSLITWIH